MTGNKSAQEVIQHTEGGDIIPAHPELALSDVLLKDTGKEYRLKEELEPIKGSYDYIIIDTPPALGILTVNALTACDSAIIPAQAEVHSLQGLGLLNSTIDAVKKYTNPALIIRGILLTRYNKRTIISQDMKQLLENAAEEMGTKVYDTPIRECTAIKEAEATQQDIFTYAPKSNAAADYTALIEDILKER